MPTSSKIKALCPFYSGGQKESLITSRQMFSTVSGTG